MIEFEVNGNTVQFDGLDDTPLLWVLRDSLGLTGTKYGCGVGQCGACTVHIDGRARRSCVTPVSSIGGRKVLTIEGLSDDGSHPVQQAWLSHDVPQCGYCQVGQIMATVDLLQTNPQPSDEQIDQAITNLCRCGTYVRVRTAVRSAAQAMADKVAGDPQQETDHA